MWKRIAQQDLRLLRRERAVFVVAALLVALTSLGIYNGAQSRNARQQAVMQAQRETQEAWRTAQKTIAAAQTTLLSVNNDRSNAAAMNPWSLRYVLGIRSVFPPNAAYPVAAEVSGIGLPPHTLALLSIGPSDLHPATTGKIGFMNFKPSLFNSYAHDNPLNLLAGNFDLAFACIYLWPLLIIALSYNLLSQEREQGTLALTLAQPVHLRALVFGKVVSRLSLTLVFGFGAAFMGIAASGIDLQTAGIIPRFVLWTACVALYVVFWFALAIAINARNGSSAMNAAALIGVWVFVVVIVPTLLSVAVSVAIPLPSRAAYLSELRLAARDYAERENDALNKNRAVPREATFAKAEAVVEMHRELYLAQRTWQERNAQITANYAAHKARQQTFIHRLRFLSPAVLLQDICNDLAGTDQARHERFIASATAYSDDWQAALLPKVLEGELLHPADYDCLPRFQFQEEPLSKLMQRTLMAAAPLVVISLLIGWAAFRWLKSYSPAG